MSRTSLSEADRRHREQFAEYARRDGHPAYRAVLDRLYGLWDDWNATFFEGRLVRPHILLAEPKSPRAVGDHGEISGWGSRNQIRIRPSLYDGNHPLVRDGEEFAEGRFRFVADVLLHETVHQYHDEVTGLTEKAYKGHGPAFRDECNRIGDLLGLPPTRIAKARGPEKSLPSCAEWPHCARPPDYYLGARRGSADPDARGEPRPIEVPKKLARWIETNPAWGEEYRRVADGLAETLDAFFARLPAPPAVVEQAVKHALRTYLAKRAAVRSPTPGSRAGGETRISIVASPRAARLVTHASEKDRFETIRP